MFDDNALLHHQHLVTDLRRDAQVVGDEQHGNAEFLLHIIQQMKHLRLHANIQRRHGLIRDQQIRLHRNGARNGNPLALTA